MRNVRYALRTLARQPVFTLVAVLTLAVGIGANTAIFSLLYQLLLRPLPYAAEDRLVFVWNSYPRIGLPEASVSIPDYLDRREQASAIEDATIFSQRGLNLTDGAGVPEQLRALRVTPSFFTTLGRTPALGRAFTEADAQIGNEHSAILTSGLWRSRFGGDPNVVGRDIRLDGEPYRVVGVLPADFELPTREVALLVPFAFTDAERSDQGRGNEFSSMIARLAPGATREQLDAQMATIVKRVAERLPTRQGFVERSGFTGYAVPIREELVGDVRTPLLVLQVGVALVLLIACANVANLLLMRATGRTREVAIRSAIGAGRARLVQQLLTEGLVLSLLGAAAGLVLGLLGVRALVALADQQMPTAVDATLHLPVLAFTLAVAVVTGLVFGVVPAWSTLRADVMSVLREDGTRTSASRGTGVVRGGLVVAEVALAVMLLIGAGLLIKSFGHLQEVDPGFSTDNVLTAQIALPTASYDEAARRAFWARLVGQATQIPGVTAVGLTSNVPFNGMVSSGSYNIVGYTPGPTEASPHGRQEVVGGDYFRAMQIPLRRGRVFDATDGPDTPRVVVIDEHLVGRYFRDRDPIGQQIRTGGADLPPATIIGVVGTINSIDLGQPVEKERLYFAVAQAPLRSMALTLKTGLDPQTLVPQVRAAVSAIDPGQPIADVRTLDQWVRRSLQTRSAPTLLLTLFAGVALVLSAIGIYGVLAFGVAQRVREFGIRQALGADRGAIISLVLTQGLRTIAAGVVLGVLGALALTRFLESQLFGVSTRDASVFAAVTVTLLVVALLSCYLPARATTRIDPMAALREG